MKQLEKQGKRLYNLLRDAYSESDGMQNAREQNIFNSQTHVTVGIGLRLTSLISHVAHLHAMGAVMERSLGLQPTSDGLPLVSTFLVFSPQQSCPVAHNDVLLLSLELLLDGRLRAPVPALRAAKDLALRATPLPGETRTCAARPERLLPQLSPKRCANKDCKGWRVLDDWVVGK